MTSPHQRAILTARLSDTLIPYLVKSLSEEEGHVIKLEALLQGMSTGLNKLLADSPAFLLVASSETSGTSIRRGRRALESLYANSIQSVGDDRGLFPLSANNDNPGCREHIAFWPAFERETEQRTGIGARDVPGYLVRLLRTGLCRQFFGIDMDGNIFGTTPAYVRFVQALGPQESGCFGRAGETDDEDVQ